MSRASAILLAVLLVVSSCSKNEKPDGLLTQAAMVESQRIIAEAHDDADRIRGGADEYAVSVLEGLEGDVTKTLQSIQKGIALLDDRRAALIAGPADAQPGLDDGDEGALDDDDWEDEPEDAAAPARP